MKAELELELLWIFISMDVPASRVTPMLDVQWLGRNLAIRNAWHRKFPRACELLKELGADLVVR